MSNAPLVACPSCSRHVRLDAPACPFCAVSLTEASLEAVPDAGGRRLSRAALFAFAATVATAACNTPQRPDTGSGSNIVQPYGAPPNPQPPPDAGAPAHPDPPSMAAIYGAPMPPPDAAAPTPAPDAAAPHATPHAAPVLPHHGAPMIRYGAPPPLDAMC
jgi:hypothetical protein